MHKGHSSFKTSIRELGFRPKFILESPYFPGASRRLLSGTVCAFLSILSIHAATYYVATTGRDSNRGTGRAPFRHLSKAAAAARHPGDTVIVLDGTYDNEGVVTTAESVRSVVMLSASGAEGKPITFRALHRGQAILDAGNTSTTICNGAWAYFDLRNASYIVIQGFVIQHGCYNGIRSNDHAHDVTIKWNEIRNIGNWDNPAYRFSPSGIFLNKTEYDFTFDGNVFHDIGGGHNVNMQHAIYTQASLVTIVNNVFYNMTHGWAVQTSGGADLVIANNTFAFPNPHRTGQIELWDNDHPGSLSNVTIRNNIFYNPLDIAVVTTLRAPILGGCTIDHNLTTARSIYDGGAPCDVRNNRTDADPRLVNVAAAPFDFHLRPGSPAAAAGAPLAKLAADCDGAPRAPGAPDLGACTVERAAHEEARGSH